MQIVTKRSAAECMEIIRLNVDNDRWSWWSTYRRPSGHTLSGKVGLSNFSLKRKRLYPSFFTALLVGNITEEEDCTRIQIHSSMNLLSRLVLGVFLGVIFAFVFFDVSIQLPFQQNMFLFLAVIGIALYFFGTATTKPDVRYMGQFVAELFNDSHVLFI